jgi:uncharacterized Zn finger protein
MTCPKCGSSDVSEVARDSVQILGGLLALPCIICGLATPLVLTFAYATLMLPMIGALAAEKISARCRACGFEIKPEITTQTKGGTK